MSIPVAIVVLTKDEPDFLDKTIRSIVGRTNYPYELFIVDNDSCLDKQKTLLNSYKKDGTAHVIFNKKNQWVLGFNKAIEVVNSRADLSSEYMVLADGDIVVPEPIDQVCWLEYLKQKMDGNITVGKLGLALDIGLIESSDKFQKTYQIEKRFMSGPVIDGLIIAPVDTTLAIYRTDLFITNKFKMLPGHASLIKPYYYVCRTKNIYLAQHLGWKNYDNPVKEQLRDKIICFTKYAGYIDSNILKETDIRTRAFHKFFKYFYKSFWAMLVLFYWAKYIASRFPRKWNEIQSRYR
jgi:glycosyltransferase involved in cell wall biosynthesis